LDTGAGCFSIVFVGWTITLGFENVSAGAKGLIEGLVRMICKSSYDGSVSLL